jgi:hypothetical protein
MLEGLTLPIRDPRNTLIHRARNAAYSNDASVEMTYIVAYHVIWSRSAFSLERDRA